MSRWCEDATNVAVVGNGPLSETDREDISLASCVIRFNDAKNLTAGERTDVAFIRSHIIDKKRVSSFSAQQVFDMYGSSVLIVPVMEQNRSIHRDSIHEFADPIVTYVNKNPKIEFAGGTKIFPECSRSVRFDRSPNGPSTGGTVLHHLESDKSVKNIHVYGMNWNGGSHHVDFIDRDMVPLCCTKCNVHVTTTNQYLP